MTKTLLGCFFALVCRITVSLLVFSASLSAQQLAVTPGTINAIAGTVGSTTKGSATYSGAALSGSLYYATSDAAQKVVVDNAGNIYFADRYFNVVRKLTPVTAPGTGSNLYGANTAYTMSTIVGTGSTTALTLPACTGGPTVASAATGVVLPTYGDGCAASGAILNTPYGLALDSQSSPTTLFITDLQHGAIRAVNLKASGNVTWAGGGTAGNIVIAPGNIATIAGTGTRTTPSDPNDSVGGTADPIDGAHGVSVDASGNVIITDTAANTIRKVTNAAGLNFTTVAGGNTNSSSQVTTGTVCSTTANAYGSAPCGDGNSPLPPSAASSSASVQFNAPEHAIADAAGNLYISDTTDYRIRFVNNGPTGTYFGVPINSGAIGTIVGLGVSGNPVDGGNAAENPTHTSLSARVQSPNQLVLDQAGALYFADGSVGEVRRVDPSGTILAVAGRYTASTVCSWHTDAIGDGCPATGTATIAAATLSNPTGVAVDNYGNIVILDGTNYVIRQVNVSTTTASFVATAIGATSATQTLTIYNTSPTTLTFTALSASNSNFSLTGSTCTSSTSLVAGASCTLVVALTPQSAGALTGTVNISSNATNALTINLNGTGTQGTSTTTETISPNPAGNGQTVTFTATVVGGGIAPTGTVIFSIGGASTSAIALTTSGSRTSIATYTTNSLAVNTYSVTATYSGDTSYTGSSSSTGTLTISNESSTTVLLSASTTSPILGNNLTLTATVSGTGSPTGSVSFYNGSILIGIQTLSGVTSTLTTSGYFLGTNSMTAYYSGDAINLSSASNTVIVKAGAAPTLFFTPGILTTVAGNGTGGYSGDGSAATGAQLNATNGIAVDAAGNLYIADTGNDAIRVVNTQNSSITVAGVTIPANAIATIAGSSNICSSSTLTACGDGGPAIAARFNAPAYIKLDVAGNIYVADTGDNAIRVINTQSTSITIAGVTIPANYIATVVGTGTACAAPTASPACGDTGQASVATLHTPRGVYVDASGNIYVVDNKDYRIRKVNASTGIITTVVGTGTICSTSTAACGDGGVATSATIASAHGIYVDPSGQIYIADTTDNRIRMVNTAGIISTIAGTGASGVTGSGGSATSAEFIYPGDTLADAAGNVYIAGGNSNNVDLINSGMLITIAGSSAGTGGYSGNGGNSQNALINDAQSIAFDLQGNLYLAESISNVIRKLSVGNSVATYANQAEGVTSVPQTINVINTGSSSLNVNSLTIPTGFVQQILGSDCTASTSLLPASYCVLNIAFDPPTPVAYSTNAVIVSNSGNAISGANSIKLSGTGTYVAPTVSLSPTALSFGNQPVGTTSTSQTIQLSNTGSSPFTISSAVITGSASYTQTNNCPAILLAQTSCIYTFSFTPTSSGTFLNTFTVTDTLDSVTSSATLSGTGIVPQVSLSQSTLSFGTQPIGVSGTAQLVTLTNTGAAPLSITSATIVGSGASSYSQTSTCGSSLAANASCSIYITFAPLSLGNQSANLSLTDNAPDSPESVSLSGTGVATAPSVALSALSLAFGNVSVGMTSSVQTVTLTNGGNATLLINSVAITGSGFAQTNNCGAQLAGGGSCVISMSFTPVIPSAIVGLLSITDNAAGSPQSIPVTGTGTAPQAVVTPTSLNFNSQYTTIPSVAQMVTLSNPGNQALNISSIALAGANAGSFSQNSTCGPSLAAGASCVINVVFAPSNNGNYSAFLTISDNIVSSPQVISLSGLGVTPEPAVTLSSTTLNFSSIVVGTTSSAQKIILQNSGAAALAINSIAVTGGVFADTTTCGVQLSAGATCTISVTYTPISVTPASGSIVITDNAGGIAQSTQSVYLSGTGIAPIASLDTSSYAFADQLPKTSSSAEIITLSNSGNAALAIGNISFSGSGASNYALTKTCGTSLVVGASCTISVIFTPASAGTFTANLVVSDNSNNVANSTQFVALTGSGSYPGSFTLSTSPNATLTTNVGGAAAYTISINPVGSSFLGPVTLSVSGLPSGATASFTPASVTPGTTGVTSNLIVKTSALAQSHSNESRQPQLIYFAALGLLLPLIRRIRSKLINNAKWILTLLAFIAVMTSGGCGVSSGVNLTDQSYVLYITGTCGSAQSTTLERVS
jgi:hypothetical protein